ncbi:MAG TPA: ABC transporter permease [Paludibacter sp.]|nr:ABC transporter permease [Paludibacter sp.]
MPNTIFTAIQQTFKRELKRMVGRPIYLLGSVGVMAFCFVFFLTFFNEGQPEKMPIAVVDLDNSSFSRQFTRNLQTSQHVDIVERPHSFKDAREEMQRGNIYAFVVIDRDFYKSTIANRRPTLTFYVNNAYLVAGSLASKDISYLSLMTSGAVQRQVLRARGVSESQVMGIVQPITVDTHLIGNPWANYGTYLLNVLLPAMLQLMALMLTTFSIGVELKERTSKAWLETAGNSIFAGLTGKLLPYTLVFSLLGFTGNLLLYKYMHFPLHSSIGWMFLASFLLVLAAQALGILFIGTLPVLRDAVTVAGVFGTLSVTAAGATFPVEQLPYFFRSFTSAFPMRHYFLIYVNQALNGIDISHSATKYFILLAFTLLPLFVYKRLKNAAILMNNPAK